jgi:hypothetical protein
MQADREISSLSAFFMVGARRMHLRDALNKTIWIGAKRQTAIAQEILGYDGPFSVNVRR